MEKSNQKDERDYAKRCQHLVCKVCKRSSSELGSNVWKKSSTQLGQKVCKNIRDEVGTRVFKKSSMELGRKPRKKNSQEGSGQDKMQENYKKICANVCKKVAMNWTKEYARKKGARN